MGDRLWGGTRSVVWQDLARMKELQIGKGAAFRESQAVLSGGGQISQGLMRVQ